MASAIVLLPKVGQAAPNGSIFHSRAGHQCRAFADIHQLIEFFFAHGPVASRINHQICSVSGIIFRLYSAVGYGAMTAVGWPQMFAQFVEPDIH